MYFFRKRYVYAVYNGIWPSGAKQQKLGIFENFCVKSNLTVNCRPKLQQKLGSRMYQTGSPNIFVGRATAPPGPPVPALMDPSSPVKKNVQIFLVVVGVVILFSSAQNAADHALF